MVGDELQISNIGTSGDDGLAIVTKPYVSASLRFAPIPMTGDAQLLVGPSYPDPNHHDPDLAPSFECRDSEAAYLGFFTGLGGGNMIGGCCRDVDTGTLAFDDDGLAIARWRVEGMQHAFPEYPLAFITDPPVTARGVGLSQSDPRALAQPCNQIQFGEDHAFADAVGSPFGFVADTIRLCCDRPLLGLDPVFHRRPRDFYMGFGSLGGGAVRIQGETIDFPGVGLVPTLTPSGFLALILLLGTAGWILIRRQRHARG
jgi:hypothetical protein